MTAVSQNLGVPLTDNDILRMGVAAIVRLANAQERLVALMETQAEAERDELVTRKLSEFTSQFDWSKYGFSVVQDDDDGAFLIRCPSGRIAKRRFHEKYGPDIWYSYAVGKEGDKVKYHKVFEFIPEVEPEPLSRKVANAVASATKGVNGTPAASPSNGTPAPAATELSKPAAPVAGEPRFTSPLMVPILAHWKALALEASQLGQADIPSRFIMQPSMAVPECQHRTDELEQFVAGLRMAKAGSAPAAAVSSPVTAKEPPPLEGARQWHAAAPRVSADNRTQLMEELQGWLRKLPACKLDLAKLSAQARMDEFGVWLKHQAVTND